MASTIHPPPGIACASTSSGESPSFIYLILAVNTKGLKKGRMEAIVDGLFSTHATRTRRKLPREELVEAVTASELRKLVLGQPGNKAPGEAVKLLAKTWPDALWTFLMNALRRESSQQYGNVRGWCY